MVPQTAPKMVPKSIKIELENHENLQNGQKTIFLSLQKFNEILGRKNTKNSMRRAGGPMGHGRKSNTKTMYLSRDLISSSLSIKSSSVALIRVTWPHERDDEKAKKLDESVRKKTMLP